MTEVMLLPCTFDTGKPGCPTKRQVVTTDHVHEETTAEATRPVFTVRPAVENISDV